VVTLEVRDGDTLRIEIDDHDGLKRDDIESACDLLSADDFTGEMVRVEVYGPRTTDMAILGELEIALKLRLQGWGRVAGFNIYIPSPQRS
jgi:hypothetical protein